MGQIDAKTQVCAILGHPVGHSLSPAIHNAAFDALELNFAYVAHDVAPDRLRQAVEGARVLGYRGLSVTIPHKVAALDCVDQVDEAARCIGCINTVVQEAGRLTGYNSDGLGALKALREADADPTDRRVVMLGSGGAARAIAISLTIEATPAELVLLGIEMAELNQLTADVQRLGRCSVQSRALTPSVLAEQLPTADLLLHCTPVGMHPAHQECLVPAELLHAGLTVFDAVYNPRRTKLLASAQAAGCQTVEGLTMFLGQAIVQFELWTGQPAPADVMRRVLEERL